MTRGTTFTGFAWDSDHNICFQSGESVPESGYYYLANQWTEGETPVVPVEPVPAPRIVDENPKDAIGRLKPNLHLVPSGALIPLARVMELGAAKYGPFNWRDSPVKASVYVSAMIRHILQFMDGADVDSESGQSHLAHAMACAAIALDAMSVGKLIDDRPSPGAAERLCDVKERAGPVADRRPQE